MAELSVRLARFAGGSAISLSRFLGFLGRRAFEVSGCSDRGGFDRTSLEVEFEGFGVSVKHSPGGMLLSEGFTEDSASITGLSPGVSSFSVAENSRPVACFFPPPTANEILERSMVW